MFASFTVRNYRLFFAGALVSNIGTWVQRVGQDWLVLTELTDGSSAALGIVTALQFLAIPILAPYAGALVDRMPKRRMLAVTQALLGLTALALWLVVALGVVELWHVYLFAFLQGVVTAFDNPARQSFVSEIVPPELLPNAVGPNPPPSHASRLPGPAPPGRPTAASRVGPPLLLNALRFGAILAAVVPLRPGELRPSQRVKARRATREGLRYLRGRPDLIVLMVIVFAFVTFGMNCQIATEIADPLERLMAIRSKSAESKGLAGSVKDIAPKDYSLLGAPLLLPGLMQMYGRAGLADVLPSAVNLTISNTAGPPFPLFCAGAKILALYPVSIPVHGIALNMTVQSYQDKLDFGITADRKAVPDVDVLADLLAPALPELKEAAQKLAAKSASA